MNRRRPWCRERDAVPRRKRVAHVVFLVVEDPRVDAVLAVVHELATDPRVAAETRNSSSPCVGMRGPGSGAKGE
jgi:hypothetical protein